MKTHKTVRVRRLICIFAGGTFDFVGLSCSVTYTKLTVMHICVDKRLPTVFSVLSRLSCTYPFYIGICMQSPHLTMANLVCIANVCCV